MIITKGYIIINGVIIEVKNGILIFEEIKIKNPKKLVPEVFELNGNLQH